MVLKVKPGEEGLQRTVGAPPPVIIERLVSVMIVLVNPFGIVFGILILFVSFDEQVGVVDLLGS